MRATVRAKILGGSAILLVLIAGLGVLAVSNLSSVNDKAQAAYSDGLIPVEKLAALDTALVDKARAVTYGVVTVGQADVQATVDSQIAADDAAISASLTDLGALPLTSEQASTLAALHSKLSEYQVLFDQIRASSKAGDAPDAAAKLQAAATVRGAAMSDVSALMSSVQNGAKDLNSQIGSTYQFGLTATVVLVGLAFVIGILVSLFLARGISRGLGAVVRQMGVIQEALVDFTHCLEGLSENDLTRVYSSHVSLMEHTGGDEVGATGEGLNSLLGQLKKMVGAYEVSRGNLTSRSSARSGRPRTRLPGPARSLTAPRTRPARRPNRSRTPSVRWPMALPTRLGQLPTHLRAPRN